MIAFLKKRNGNDPARAIIAVYRQYCENRNTSKLNAYSIQIEHVWIVCIEHVVVY
jgi:hypothetical protein